MNGVPRAGVNRIRSTTDGDSRLRLPVAVPHHTATCRTPACHHVPVRGLLLLLLLGGFALGGCGGNGSGPGFVRTAPARGGKAPGARGADSSDARVIRGWSDSLRGGDVGRATRYFGLPTVVQNGGLPLRLSTAGQVRAFNVLLPCGARLVRTQAAGRYTLAEFVLTERTGAGGGRCDGAGAKGATAFRIAHGKILEWRRISGLPAPGAPAPEPPPLPPSRPAAPDNATPA